MKNLIILSAIFFLTFNTSFAQSDSTQKKETAVENTPKNSTVVSSINRRNYYIGLFFTRNIWNANYFETLGSKDPESFKKTFEQGQILYTVLKGKIEQGGIENAFTKFKTEKNFNVLSKEISRVSIYYAENIPNEQKFYFRAGEISAQIENGIGTKNKEMFLWTKLEFDVLFKNPPTEIPSALIASLKKTSEIAQGDFSDDDSENYEKLYNQLKVVQEIIGQLSSSDLN